MTTSEWEPRVRALLAESAVPGLGVAVATGEGPHARVSAGVADVRTGRPVDARTVFHACSTAKLVTTLGVLALVRDGVLGLDHEVEGHLEHALPRAPTAEGPVTLAHLLGHRAGIDDAEGSFAPADGDLPAIEDVLAGRTHAHPGPVTVGRTPGESFSYSDAGYCLVERVVERVTGERFAEVMHRLVMAPLGLSSTAFWGGERTDVGSVATGRRAVLARVRAHAAAGHGPDGAPVPDGRVHYPGLAASGLWSTPADLAVLLEALGRAWGADGELPLLGSEALAMRSRCDSDGVGPGMFLLASPVGPCVMSQGWGVGFQGQSRAYPDAGGVVVVLINADPGAPQSTSLVGDVIGAVATAHGWR